MRRRKVMGHAKRRLRVQLRSEDIFFDGAAETDRVHCHRGIPLSIRAGRDEVRMSAVTKGASEMTFEQTPRLRRPRHRKVILRIEDCVAKQEVCLSVILLRAGLGGDLDATSSGPGELGGVRI